MSEAGYLLIIEYNFIRLRDILTAARYAQRRYGLKTILIKRDAKAADRANVEHVLELDHLAPDFVSRAMDALAPYRGKLQGGLVFSDSAIVAGSQLLQELGLKTDDPKNAQAGLSKVAYREAEALFQPFAAGQNLFLPRFAAVDSVEAAKAFLKDVGGAMILKPACEGNNKGVVRITHPEQIEQAWKDNAAYAYRGIMCEELIRFPEEYSFDGVGQTSFITRKINADGDYPVERGQIVSGDIGAKEARLVTRAGLIANIVTGQYHGPFHNEVKIDAARNLAAIIEPNRRPAGMRVWDLAERVYGVNFYHLWVDRILSNQSESEPELTLKPNGSAFTLALALDRETTLDYSTFYEENPLAFGKKVFSDMDFAADPGKGKPELFGFEFLAPRGTVRGSVLKTNVDFSAFVTVWVPSGMDVRATVAHTENYWYERGIRQALSSTIAA